MTRLLAVRKEGARVHWLGADVGSYVVRGKAATACGYKAADMRSPHGPIRCAVTTEGLERVALLDCEPCGAAMCAAALGSVLRLRAGGHRVAVYEDSITLAKRRLEEP